MLAMFTMRPQPFSPHPRDEGAAEVEGAGHVDGHGPGPLMVSNLPQRPARADDPRAVDQDVDRADAPAASLTASASVTSSWTSAPGAMSSVTTSTPSRARRSALAWPRPLAAPVTTAVRVGPGTEPILAAELKRVLVPAQPDFPGWPQLLMRSRTSCTRIGLRPRLR